MARNTHARVAAILVLAAHVQGCIELFGYSRDSLKPQTNPATAWDYGFRGDNWPGTCKTGSRQSPLNLPHLTQPVELGVTQYRTTMQYGEVTSNGTSAQVFNNGHTIQVQWAAGMLTSDVTVTTAGRVVTDVLGMSAPDNAGAKTVKATPLQFHFHTDSEHAVDGAFYPLEMHIVHNVAQADLPGCPAGGCFTVVGIMFALADNDNPALDAIWSAMPLREGQVVNLPAGTTIDVGALLPKDLTYISYEGSLTTPPCTEGLLWHVLTTPIPISLNQLRKYQTAVGLKDCTDGPAANATAPAATAGGRKMLSGHTHDHEESHGHKLLIQRGMKEGFQLISAAQAAQVTPVERGNGRTLLQAPLVAGEPVCEVVSFGFSNRNPQKANNRVIRLFTHPNSASLLGADAGAGTSGAADLRALTQATRDAVDDQKNLILGVGLGVGLGGTLLVLAALGAAVAVLKAGRSGSGAAHMDVHVAK